MLPLALKLEAGGKSRAPMAVVIIGGVISSTLLSLLLVPVMYTLLEDAKAQDGSRFRLATSLAAILASTTGGTNPRAGRSRDGQPRHASKPSRPGRSLAANSGRRHRRLIGQGARHSA